MTDTAFDVTPVGILTGFLGSGKTTLLRRWLTSEGFGASGQHGGTAVLINEFGAIGLDHLLVGAIDADTVLLDNGCICCSIRGELKDALMRLHSRRQRGELPPFERVVIETTGLATPGPVLATLLADAQLRHHFRPAFVATVVDAVHAAQQRERHAEWTAQVAGADTLWLSKTDLVDAAQAAALRTMLAGSNPAARQIDVAQRPGAANAAEPAWWLENSAADSFRNSAQWIARAGAGSLRRSEGAGSLRRSAGAGISLAGSGDNGSSNAQPSAPTHATSFCMTFDRPIEWVSFTLWLTLLVHRHGDRLLRIKGLLDIAADATRQGQSTVLHGIGHLMHPPEHLDAWPDDDRRSRLVFITQGLSEEAVAKSWRDFENFYAMDETA